MHCLLEDHSAVSGREVQIQPDTLLHRLEEGYRGGEESPRQGLTLIELLVVMAVIAILAALGLPAIQRARHAALEMNDANHLRQLCLAVQQHAEMFDRLPGPHTGFAGSDAGWSFSVLLGSGDAVVLNAFDPARPLDHAVNLRIAERSRPAIFSATTTDDSPYRVSATDEPGVLHHIRPTAFAFNGFLLHKRIEHLRASSQTAMFARFGPCGMWLNSPEFYSIEPPKSGRPVLIGFADGSVSRRTSLEGVIVDPFE